MKKAQKPKTAEELKYSTPGKGIDLSFAQVPELRADSEQEGLLGLQV